MKKMKFLNTWMLVSGIIICIISLIHNAFTPFMYNQIFENQNMQEYAPGFAFFFVLGGTAFLFAGILIIYSVKDLKKSEKWAWNISLGSSMFIALSQTFAVVFGKFGNFLIYMLAFFSITNFFALIIYPKKKLKE